MNKQTLQQLIDTYKKESGYLVLDSIVLTEYDIKQIALRYAELAVKEERERIVGIIESQSKYVILESYDEWWNGSSEDILFKDLSVFDNIINEITKVEE